MKATEIGELAFENWKEGTPGTLWRVLAWKEWGGRRIRRVKWFTSYEAASDWCEFLATKDIEVESVSKYELQISQ